MRFFNGPPMIQKALDSLVFWAQPKGLLSAVPDISVPPDFAVDATNLMINEFGVYQVRPGLKQVTTAACGAAIKTIAYVPIDGTYYTLLVDADYKLYSCTGTEPNLTPGTAIATLEGEAAILPFNGYAVILDGSYIKYFDGTDVKLAYDDGTGSSAAQHDTSCEIIASAKAKTLYTGSNTMAGAKITTQAWTSGYTIDITTAIFWLKKSGTPTGSVYARLYSDDSGPDTLLATSDAVDASTLTTQYTKVNFTFSTGTLGLSPETDYYVVVYYDDGDVDNNIIAGATTQTSGGDMNYYDGTWKTDATADALVRVRPGKPPKASFGGVKSTRLFVAGDPDNTGYMWFSNVNTLFDWSTEDAAGFVSSVDDDANSFPIGAIIAHYGDIYVFGKKEQPYLCKLTGAAPSAFSLPLMWQKTYTDYKSLLSLPNDMWIASNDGLASLAGVQQYGDLRISPNSNPVFDKFVDNWDTDAFIGYNPANQQIVIKLTGISKTLVCNLSANGTAWTWYDFKGITPTAFDSHLGVLYVGGSDGHLYQLDQSLHQDDGEYFDIDLESGIIEQPFGAAFLDNAYISASSQINGFKVDIFINGDSSSVYSQTWSNNARAMQRNIHVRGDSLKVKLSEFAISGRGSLSSLVFMRRRLPGRKNL